MSDPAYAEMRGRRIDWPADVLPVDITDHMERGDYAGPWRGWLWVFCAPNGDVGSIDARGGLHTVEEHEDGTISVQPSLNYHFTLGALRADEPNSDEARRFDVMWIGSRYHGWLKHGVWSGA